MKDDERYSREMDIRTSKVFGKICHFLGEHCCISVKTISTQFEVDITTVHRCEHVQSLFTGCLLISELVNNT